jgi:chromosome partitioning protein
MMLNLKGGVAKTANCVAMAETLAEAGRRVLVIDADHQCMSSLLLLGEDRYLKADTRGRTLHDLLRAMLDDEFEEEGMEPFVLEQASNIGGGYANLHIIPCSLRIDDFQANMAKARLGHRSNEVFLQMLAKKRGVMRRFMNSRYDYVLIDCPPSLALQVRQLLLVTDAFIIPSVPDRLSVRGSLLLMERLARNNYRRGRGLGTVWSMYRQQARAHREIVKAAAAGESEYEGLPRPFDTIIPNAAKIAEAMNWDAKPPSLSAKYTSRFASLYGELCMEMIRRLRSA